MSLLNETFTLKNGVMVPKIGLGTWQITDEAIPDVVRTALKNGYRHIDTAVAYANAKGIARGIAESGVDRKEIFLTSKIEDTMKNYEGTKKQIDEILSDFNTDYMDLLLIHAPRPWSDMFNPTGKTYNEENLEVWRALEEAYQAGKVRAIGVSNFAVQDIQNLLDHAETAPMVHQYKYHIGNTSEQLTAFSKAHGMQIEGYSPIATGMLLGNETIEKIAEKYQASILQICVRYALQNGVIPLPKSTHETFMVQNASVDDFVISDEDMSYLNAIHLDIQMKERKDLETKDVEL